MSQENHTKNVQTATAAVARDAGNFSGFWKSGPVHASQSGVFTGQCSTRPYKVLHRLLSTFDLGRYASSPSTYKNARDRYWTEHYRRFNEAAIPSASLPPNAKAILSITFSLVQLKSDSLSIPTCRERFKNKGVR